MKTIKAARSRTGVTFVRQADGSFLKSAPQQAVKTYDAGMFNRLTGDWKVNRLSADAEMQGKIEIIRSRSRDHEQNDPYAENFLKLRENNVVGHDGFTLQMKVKLSEELDPATGEIMVELDTVSNLAIERAWRRFCQRKNFLVTRDLHAIEACKLIERTLNRDGDLLIRKIKGAPNEFGFGLELLEADYLDDRFIDFRGVPCDCPNQLTLPNGQPFPYCQTGQHEVRMGVELHGDWKFPVAYWLLANHPGDYFFGNQYSTKRIRVPVDEVIHPYVHKRIGQTRGLPATIAAMLRLQMIGGMDEAALVAARAGAQKMGVITKTIPDDFQADEDYLNGTLERTIEGSPGEFLELPMGFDVKSIDWKNPDNAYAPFQKTQLRGAAMGMGVSYHSLAGDLESVNFSSGRLGEMEQREGFRGGQSSFIRDVLLQIFPDFLEAAMLSGLVDLPFSRFDEFTDEENICFSGRGFPFYDPTKDIAAAQEAVDLGVTTRAQICAENGRDFEQVTTELGREERLRTSAGLVQTLAPGDTTVQGDPSSEGDRMPNDDQNATKGFADQPRDDQGRWISGGGPVGKEGNWKSLGLASAENLPAIARPRTISTKDALKQLSRPYAKEDPMGNIVGFGSRLKEHLKMHVREGHRARPEFLPHMEAAVENPAEIWSENTDQGPRIRHITSFKAADGTRSFAVISHQTGETRADIISGTPKTHPGINKMRKGKLLYIRPEKNQE